MGDRGNIFVKHGPKDTDGVYLYSHWTGTDLPEILQNVLKRHERWDDEPYLTRMIFCAMVGNDMTASTGYGISTKVHDNEHSILRVDCASQAVKVGGKRFSFREYCEIDFSKDLPWDDSNRA